jgi:carboxylesterase
MRPLQAPLESLGVKVSLPLMRGHGAASPQALQGVTWADCLADCARTLVALGTRVDRVILVGPSMGALVALQLAANNGDCGHQLDSLPKALGPTSSGRSPRSAQAPSAQSSWLGSP